MNKRQLHLLGVPRVIYEEGDVPRFRSQRTVALLGYLVAERRRLSRAGLAALFWPDEPADKAKANLRRELHNLGQILPGCWETDRTQVRFVPTHETAIDLDAVQQYAAAGEWQAAADLVRGDFLEGIDLEANPDFESWLLTEREHWRQQAETVLHRAIDAYISQAAYPIALDHAHRLLQLTPWHEATHRQMMQLLAWTDQRAAALRQYQICVDILDSELGLPPDPETTQLYDEIRAGKPLFPPSVTASPSPPRHNLPAQTTPFIGRDQELVAISRLLNEPTIRLITIFGPGGMGKTRLALAAAQQFIETNQYRVGFVDLAPLAVGDDIIPAIAEAVGYPFQQGKRSPKQQLLDYLRAKQFLLLLDNFEHLLAQVNLVHEILQAGPRISVLVTSRERLQLSGETVFMLEGMAFPAPASVENAQHSHAVQLFSQGAKRIRPDITLNGNDLAAVSQICRLVQGMPLAILLAAAWIDLLSPQEIADEIEKSLDFLATDLHDVPDRQRSIQALFEHSWQQLTERERIVFMKLAIFRGGFTRDAAQEVAGASLRLLGSLANKALLQPQRNGRYTLHELIRQYSAQQLSRMTDVEVATRNLHSSYYCHWLQTQESRLKSSNQHAALAEIEENIQNIRTAWEWAAVHGQVAYIQKALESLNCFYDWSGMIVEGEDSCQRTIKAFATTTTQQALSLSAQLLVWQGVFSRKSGDLSKSERLLTQSIAILDSLGLIEEKHINAKAFALLHMGGIDREKAKEFRLRSLKLYKETDNKWGAAIALEYLSSAHQMRGEHVKADRYLQTSLQLREAIGDQTGIAISLRALGLSALDRGDTEKAERLIRRALEIVRQSRNYFDIGRVLHPLASVLLRAGRFEESVTIIEEYLALYKDQIGVETSRLPFTYLGEAVLHLGNYDQARLLIEQHLALARKVNNELHIGLCLVSLVMEALTQEKYAQAQSMAREAIDIWQKNGYQFFLGQALALFGFAASVLDSLYDARNSFVQAIKIGITQSIILPLMYALPGIALLFAKQQKDEKAVEIYESALRQPYICNSRWFENTVGQHITSSAQRLSSDVLAAAQARGQKRDLWETSHELLKLLAIDL